MKIKLHVIEFFKTVFFLSIRNINALLFSHQELIINLIQIIQKYLT